MEALAFGEILAELAPVVDQLLAPLERIAETGDPSSGGSELATEVSVDQFLNIVTMVLGTWPKVVARGIERLDKVAGVKALKEGTLEALGDMIGDRVREIRDTPERGRQQE